MIMKDFFCGLNMGLHCGLNLENAWKETKKKLLMFDSHIIFMVKPYVPLKSPNGYTFEVNGYSSKPMRMKYFLWFLKMRKILTAHWLRACIHSSQKCIHLGPLTVFEIICRQSVGYELVVIQWKRIINPSPPFFFFQR